MSDVRQNEKRERETAKKGAHLCLVADAEHAKVGMEQVEEVVGLCEDVPSRVLVARGRVDELACLEPTRERDALNVARDALPEELAQLAHGERHAVAVAAVRVERDEPPQVAKGRDRDRHGRAHAHVAEVLDVDRRHGPQVTVRHVERDVDLVHRAAAQARRRLVAVVQDADLVEAVQCARLRRDVRRGEVEPAEEVLGAGPVYLFGHDAAVPRLVELVHHDPVELGQLLEDACRDLEERLELVRLAQLVVDLAQEPDHVEVVEPAAHFSSPHARRLVAREHAQRPRDRDGALDEVGLGRVDAVVALARGVGHAATVLGRDGLARLGRERVDLVIDEFELEHEPLGLPLRARAVDRRVAGPLEPRAALRVVLRRARVAVSRQRERVRALLVVGRVLVAVVERVDRVAQRVALVLAQDVGEALDLEEGARREAEDEARVLRHLLHRHALVLVVVERDEDAEGLDGTRRVYGLHRRARSVSAGDG